ASAVDDAVWPLCDSAPPYSRGRCRFHAGRRHVYVIGSAGSTRIEIGTSVSPEKRLKELQTGNPDRLEVQFPHGPDIPRDHAQREERGDGHRDHRQHNEEDEVGPAAEGR
ncbi:GIY-YIG nuclease family protein, partial [Streptomyces sp. NPDC056831]|uniref:GIY-YIG nuclease family protein n=1 Tax=Streptomyces sp. NPDC056831 TaxID=3345954 RepID=UPI0036BC7BD7